MNPRRPRIAITPEALRTARILAALEGLEPSDYLSALVLREAPRIPRESRTSGITEAPAPALRDPPAPQEPGAPQDTPKIRKRAPRKEYRPPIDKVPGLGEKILAMAAQGKGTTEIGQAVGRTPQTITGWLKKQKAY